MNKLLTLIFALTFGASVLAQEATCQAAATEKKLASAGENSFEMKFVKGAVGS